MPQLTGKFVRLRFVKESDADFIWKLRSNEALNAHLSATSGGAAGQARWIAGYKEREALGQEAYFVIERRDGPPVGLVRLYDPTENAFMFGSFILFHEKPKLAALEAAILAIGYGFEVFDRGKVVLDVRKENHRAIGFYERFGFVETHANAVDRYYEMTKSAFEARRPELQKTIEKLGEAA